MTKIQFAILKLIKIAQWLGLALIVINIVNLVISIHQSNVAGIFGYTSALFGWMGFCLALKASEHMHHIAYDTNFNQYNSVSGLSSADIYQSTKNIMRGFLDEG